MTKIKKAIKKITPSFFIKTYHFMWSFFGALYYGFPSRKMKVIGITGTNGKSTTVKIVAEILKERGRKVAVVSSIDFEIAGEKRKNLMKMTMPGRGFIHKFMKESLNKGCETAVLEVTSQGIEQFRHSFIDFNMAVITNLSPEHIEAHGGFDNYRAAKGCLFNEVNEIHILNMDDKHVDYFKAFKAKKKYGYGLECEGSGFDEIVQGEDLNCNSEGINFEVDGERLNLSLVGEFNAYNGLAAICVGKEMGIKLKDIKDAFKKVNGIPGRMEKVIDQDFKVFVDYAFTPNALQKVYESVIKKMNPRKLIVVLGACGGGRDKWKRPVLGKIANKFADEIIVTNEDPYDEDPKEIIEQVAKGTEGRARIIINRREAINKALSLAESGDIVVITGKGSESWIQGKNGKKTPWNDREATREEYKKIIN